MFLTAVWTEWCSEEAGGFHWRRFGLLNQVLCGSHSAHRATKQVNRPVGVSLLNVRNGFVDISPRAHTVQLARSAGYSARSSPLHVHTLELLVHFVAHCFDVSSLCGAAETRETHQQRPFISLLRFGFWVPVNSYLATVFEGEFLSVVVNEKCAQIAVRTFINQVDKH